MATFGLQQEMKGVDGTWKKHPEICIYEIQDIIGNKKKVRKTRLIYFYVTANKVDQKNYLV